MSRNQSEDNKHNDSEHKHVAVSCNPKRSVDISRLKDFAANELPHGSPLREAIVSQDNELNVNVFMAMLSVWLRLSKFRENWRMHP